MCNSFITYIPIYKRRLTMKTILTILTTVLTTIVYSQPNAYSDSYKFFTYNENTEQWDYVMEETKYSKFIFPDDDYFLVESENQISKYDVVSSKTVDDVTMFTIKETGGKIYYMSFDKEHIYFIHNDEDGMYQIEFNVYLWEK